MDKADLLSTYMVVWSLEPKKGSFWPKKPDEEIFGLKVPYLNAIGALMYLAQCKRPYITFAVNLLECFSFEPTTRYWNGIKHILRYLKRTIDLRLFYSKESNSTWLVGYIDAGYKSNPHKVCSQIGYLFCYNDTTIS